jgi:hypothetical protein
MGSWFAALSSRLKSRGERLSQHGQQGNPRALLLFCVTSLLLVLLAFIDGRPTSSFLASVLFAHPFEAPSRIDQHHHRSLLQQQRRQPSKFRSMNGSKAVSQSKARLLYVVTSSSLYYHDKKTPKVEYDRLHDIFWPVVLEGVSSFHHLVEDDPSGGAASQQQLYEVDVFLVLGYTISDQEQRLLASQLPPGTGLEVWNDAEPFKVHPETLDLTRAKAQLARQHRYVIKDKLAYYDFFVCIEDDMLVTKTQVEYHRETMRHLDVLKQAAPDDPLVPSKEEHYQIYWGSLTRKQLERMRPGFVRTEVWSPKNKETSKELDPSPIFLYDDDSVAEELNRQSFSSDKRVAVDPRHCCHHSHFVGLQGNRAAPYPNVTDLIVWETHAHGTSVRRMPDESFLGWVALLPGPHKDPTFRVDGYWTGLADMTSATDSDKIDYAALLRQSPKRITGPDYVANSAGWMSSSREVMDLHEHFCQGGFVPPFDLPIYPQDGLPATNVEFWSGGIQLWCAKCNMQRFLVLDPKHFSKHLLYHTANNKQHVIASERLIRVNDYFGQLHAAKRAANAYKRYKISRTTP